MKILLSYQRQYFFKFRTGQWSFFQKFTIEVTSLRAMDEEHRTDKQVVGLTPLFIQNIVLTSLPHGLNCTLTEQGERLNVLVIAAANSNF